MGYNLFYFKDVGGLFMGVVYYFGQKGIKEFKKY